VKQHGAELDANFRANDVLTLHGALSYVRDTFHDYIGQCYAYAFPTGSTRATATPPPNCSFANTTTLALQQNFEGRTPARAPKWSGNLGGIVSLPIGESRIEMTGDGQYTSSYYAADTLVEASKQRSYWLLNSSVSYVAPNDRWKISLIGKNLSNKYIIGYAADRTGGAGVPGQVGEQRGAVQRGREVTLQAAVSF
jgi:outer membrane receptor protein involved in Fe transport